MANSQTNHQGHWRMKNFLFVVKKDFNWYAEKKEWTFYYKNFLLAKS